jgi:hypothetical protein
MQTQPSPQKDEQIVAEDNLPRPIIIRKLDRLETTTTWSSANGG